ncbi:hypothetical protein LSH36_1091g00234 [Paralvinella palmiformis]|uniref:plant cystathionine gamma-synthase n=1 Tax=Paralvinella palmiformis TaxID=53620 RepID=A0AAD9IW76_9ANNE|nr:hypothetical protein LSH36_1091g00234 [Paralvinella palmiformis]
MNSGHRFKTVHDAQSLFYHEKKGFVYGRWENPNTLEYVRKLCTLEDYPDGIATTTGMAAITAVFLGLLKSGDHIVYCDALFGTSRKLIKDFLPRWGIQSTAVPASASGSMWQKAITDQTKLIYLETPSNPDLSIIDLSMICTIANPAHVLVCVDNSFATPYLQNPQKWGVDITIHSATKFIDGQGRTLAGVVLANEELMRSIKAFAETTGPSLSPFSAWLLSKSLETLSIRMQKHCENAQKVMQYLLAHSQVASVRYPFHPSHPSYEVARKQMRLGGGLVTFDLKQGYEAGIKMIEKLSLFTFTANLGDSKTLITHPASTTHSKLSQEERFKLGIGDAMIRVSVGLEHIDDILTEFDRIL